MSEKALQDGQITTYFFIKANNVDNVIKLHEQDPIKLLQVFCDDQIKAYNDKSNFFASGKGKVTIRVQKTEIVKSDCGKLQGIKINSKLHFAEQQNDIISKTSHKVNVLSRITSFTNIAKKQILMNSFFST